MKKQFHKEKNMTDKNNVMLTKDDIETILINLNASKENLCNRGLWNIAEEYQQLIDKILLIFADTLEEKANEYKAAK